MEPQSFTLLPGAMPGRNAMIRIVVLAAVAVSMSGCVKLMHKLGGHQTVGSGNLKTEKRSLSDFDEIVVAGSADCVVTVGKGTSVEVKADDNILPLIETSVSGNVLRIECKGSYSSKNPTIVTISTPSLASFSIRGSGDAQISGLSGNSFKASIAGSGDITATGRTKDVSAEISGSGDIDLSGLIAEKANASIAGSGDIAIHASSAVEASIRGSGDIVYRGDPKNVNQSVFGSGEIRKG
jgi:hypothetical protein